MEYNMRNFQRGVSVQMAIRNWRVSDVIQATGLSRNTISNILNTKKNDGSIKCSTLNKFCMSFECTPNDLFKEEPKDWHKKESTWNRLLTKTPTESITQGSVNMNNEQAQLALEKIGSKIKLEMDSSMPSFRYGNEPIGYVSTSSISIYPGGGYLKHKITDEEYSILIQLLHTRLDDRIVNDTFSKFTDSLRRADEPTRTKIINYVKELIASDSNTK